MLRYVKITRDNIDTAIRLQHQLFPDYSARVNYEESVSGATDYDYFLVYEGDTIVGISGLYHYPADPESAWLGWFGILEPFRRRHYGSETVRLFEELSRERGYRFARLYTDRDDNERAISFYKANGYSMEHYMTGDDPVSLEIGVLIFSKSLDGGELVPWNNRNIGLTEQVVKQNERR